MLNSLEKAKEIGVITLDRVNDYVELIRVEFDLAQRGFIAKAGSLLLIAATAFFAAIFIGFAVIVSYWETDYRILAAWLVAAFWILAALASYLRSRKNLGLATEVGMIRHAVQQDIAFLKELL